VLRLVAAGLLVVMAVLAFGGSFGTYTTWSYVSPVDNRVISTTYNGWWAATDQPVEGASEPTAVPDGILLTIGALLAVVAAVMLTLTARRAGDPPGPRLVGVTSAAFLLGLICLIWLGQIISLRDYSSTERNDTYQYTLSVGLGSWLLLVAGVVALAVLGLLLTPRRSATAGWPMMGAGAGAPYGPSYGAAPAYPPGPAGPPGYPPAPDGPPAGWPAPPHPTGFGPQQASLWGRPQPAEPPTGTGAAGDPWYGNRPTGALPPDNPPPNP
jgi:hypothetical protein